MITGVNPWGRGLAFRVLTGNKQPNHSLISEFRRRNLYALKGLFIQILRLCQKPGMLSLGHVALDGTKCRPMPLSTCPSPWLLRSS